MFEFERSEADFCLIRNDISGALATILENAPYGPSVDEAKVRTPLELILLLQHKT